MKAWKHTDGTLIDIQSQPNSIDYIIDKYGGKEADYTLITVTPEMLSVPLDSKRKKYHHQLRQETLQFLKQQGIHELVQQKITSMLLSYHWNLLSGGSLDPEQQKVIDKILLIQDFILETLDFAKQQQDKINVSDSPEDITYNFGSITISAAVTDAIKGIF